MIPCVFGTCRGKNQSIFSQKKVDWSLTFFLSRGGCGLALSCDREREREREREKEREKQ